MLDRPLAAFDIETIPDPDVGRRILGLEGDDETVIRAMVERRLEETDGKSSYPQLPHHRVVTIAVAWMEPRLHGSDGGRFKLGVMGGDPMAERSHLEGFFRLFSRAKTAPRLISWNGSGFDLPVIRYRSLLHGVAAPAFYRTDGDWKWNNYQGRYHDLHVDLMDLLSGYGASHWTGLGTIAELLELPGKSFLAGEVWEHVVRGEEAVVRQYCMLDVLLTLLVFLRWTVHRGDLSREQLAALVATIRSVVTRLEHPGWKEIAAHLERWPGTIDSSLDPIGRSRD